MFKEYCWAGFVAMLIIISCTSEQNVINMVGTWETVYLHIDMPTHKGSDTVYSFVADFTDTTNREQLPIARSIYKPDGTFVAYYVLPDGNETGHSDGTWKLQADTLEIKYELQGKVVNARYGLTKTEQGWNGKNIYDWDEDNVFDDTLLMKVKRLK